MRKLLLAALLLTVSAAALAQAYPSRPVRAVVPLSPEPKTFMRTGYDKSARVARETGATIN